MKTVFTLYTSASPVLTDRTISFKNLSYDGKKVCRQFATHLRRYFPYVIDKRYNVLLQIETSYTVNSTMYQFILWLIGYYLLSDAKIHTVTIKQGFNGTYGSYTLTIEVSKKGDDNK